MEVDTQTPLRSSSSCVRGCLAICVEIKYSDFNILLK